MEIMTKKEAKSKGMMFYFTGKPCIHGHIAERYVSKGTCKECNLTRHEYNSKRYDEMPEYYKGYAARKRKNNPGYCNAKTSEYRVKKIQATMAWANMKLIEEFYAEARRLEEVTGIKFHVDHVVPLKGKNVSGLHVESNLQIIPAHVNLRKSNTYTGV